MMPYNTMPSVSDGMKVFSSRYSFFIVSSFRSLKKMGNQKFLFRLFILGICLDLGLGITLLYHPQQFHSQMGMEIPLNYWNHHLLPPVAEERMDVDVTPSSSPQNKGGLSYSFPPPIMPLFKPVTPYEESKRSVRTADSHSFTMWGDQEEQPEFVTRGVITITPPFLIPPYAELGSYDMEKHVQIHIEQPRPIENQGQAQSTGPISLQIPILNNQHVSQPSIPDPVPAQMAYNSPNPDPMPIMQHQQPLFMGTYQPENLHQNNPTHPSQLQYHVQPLTPELEAQLMREMQINPPIYHQSFHQPNPPQLHPQALIAPESHTLSHSIPHSQHAPMPIPIPLTSNFQVPSSQIEVQSNVQDAYYQPGAPIPMQMPQDQVPHNVQNNNGAIIMSMPITSQINPPASTPPIMLFSENPYAPKTTPDLPPSSEAILNNLYADNYGPVYASTYDSYSKEPIGIESFEHAISSESYSVEFKTENGIQSKEEGHLKLAVKAEEPVVDNSYSPASDSTVGVVHVKSGEVTWTSPECITFTLKYEADEFGYRPSIIESSGPVNCLKYGKGSNNDNIKQR